jgi:uncharacterized protein
MEKLRPRIESPGEAAEWERRVNVTVLDVGSGHLIRFFHRENVISGLTEIAQSLGITAGWVNGLGALAQAELGYYEIESRTYRRLAIEEDVEITSLVGNVSWVDDSAFFHLHATLGKKDFSTVAGHLFQGTAGATVEIALFSFPGIRLERRRDEEIGLNLWHLPPWTPSSG